MKHKSLAARTAGLAQNHPWVIHPSSGHSTRRHSCQQPSCTHCTRGGVPPPKEGYPSAVEIVGGDPRLNPFSIKQFAAQRPLLAGARNSCFGAQCQSWTGVWIAQSQLLCDGDRTEDCLAPAAGHGFRRPVYHCRSPISITSIAPLLMACRRTRDGPPRSSDE